MLPPSLQGVGDDGLEVFRVVLQNLLGGLADTELVIDLVKVAEGLHPAVDQLADEGIGLAVELGAVRRGDKALRHAAAADAGEVVLGGGQPRVGQAVLHQVLADVDVAAAEGLHHGGVDVIEGVAVEGAVDAAGPQDQEAVRVLRLAGEQGLHLGDQVLRVGEAAEGAEEDHMDIVFIEVGRRRVHDGLRREDGLLPRRAAREVVFGVVGGGVDGQSALDTSDGDGVDAGVAARQGVDVLFALGLELDLHRLRSGGDGDLRREGKGHGAAAAEDGVAVLLAAAHVDDGDADLIVVPPEAGVVLRVLDGAAEVVDVAEVGVEIDLQYRGVRDVPRGAERGAVAPADNAGQVLRDGLHVPVIGGLDGADGFLPGLVLLLLLLDVHLGELLVMLLGLAAHMQHHQKQARENGQDDEGQDDIDDQMFSSVVFPHMLFLLLAESAADPLRERGRIHIIFRVLAEAVLAHRGHGGEKLIVREVVDHVGEVLDREIRAEERLHRAVCVCHEVGVCRGCRAGRVGKGGEIQAVVRHADVVAVDELTIAPAHKAEGRLALQGDVRAFDVLVAEGGDVVLQGDGDAADQVVRDGDGVHGESEVVVDGDAVEEVLDRVARVDAAVFLAAAVGVGEGDLLVLRAADQPVDRQPRHVAHGVAVNLEGRDGMGAVVEDQDDQEVREVVVVEGLDLQLLGVVYKVVRADEQDGGEAALQGDLLAVERDGLHVAAVQRLLADGGALARFAAFLEEEDAPRDEQDQQQVEDEEQAFSVFLHGSVTPFEKGRSENRPLVSLNSRDARDNQSQRIATAPSSVSLA